MVTGSFDGLPAIVLAIREHHRRTDALLEQLDGLSRGACDVGRERERLLAECSDRLRAGDARLERLASRLDPPPAFG